MPSFAETSRSALAHLARRMAEALVPRGASTIPPFASAPNSRFVQPLRLIPGMPSAAEPCLLPLAWSAETHPRDAVAQLKVDGVRALYVDTNIVSREALPLDCALHCLPALHQLEEWFGEKMVFDGEYREPDGFQATLAAMKRGEGVGTIHLFDAVPYGEWAANRFTRRLDHRFADLWNGVAALDSPFVQALNLIAVPTPADAQALAETFWAQGQEGIVVKSLRDHYERGKSRRWLKLKRRQTFDGIITDMLVKDGRCQALMVRMPDDSPSPGKVVRVGANISDNMRAVLGFNPGLFQGQVVEIGFTDTTDTGNLRGGYFIRMRNDKKGLRNV